MTLRPLVAPSLRSGATAQGLRIINSVDPWVLKSNYYLKYEGVCYFLLFGDDVVESDRVLQ